MSTTVDKPILKWQLEQIVKELILLQLHATDPTCPCATEGEFCTRKHLLTIEAYAQETMPIADDDELKAKCYDLAIEAKRLREQEEAALCGNDVESEIDVADWARQWRKQFEESSIACPIVKVQRTASPDDSEFHRVELFNTVQHVQTTCELVSPQHLHMVPWFEFYGSETLFAVEVEQTGRKIDEVMRQLEAGIKGILESDAYMQHLLAMSRFHHYSMGNIMLIALQRSHATYVAGYKTWQDLGRYVRKGEKGIAILAPCLPEGKTGKVPLREVTSGTMIEVDGKAYTVGHKQDRAVAIRAPDGTERLLAPDTMVRLMGGVTDFAQPRYFKVVYVFDISQTEGQELPTIEVPSLTSEIDDELWQRFLDYTAGLPVTVSFQGKPNLAPDIKGYFKPVPGEVWVKPDEPRAQQAKTLLHETAHYHTHQEPVGEADHETIAESVAFVVGAHFGFDTGVRSFPYVALWAQDMEVLKRNLETIRTVSIKMIDSMSVMARVEKSEHSPISEEELRHLIDQVPDENNPDLINYWQSIEGYEVYLEGWADACLSGTGFPPMERGGTSEKIEYIEDMTKDILQRIAEERGLILVDGGFKELEDAENLYGVTWGIYSKDISREMHDTTLQGPGITIPVPAQYAKFKVETKLVRSRAWDPELDMRIGRPGDAIDVSRKIEGSDRERVLALYLDTKNNLVGVQQVSIGERSAAMIAPDVVYRTAVLTNSAGIIMIHNHPSGSVEASPEDIAAAQRLRDGARLMDVEVLDFIVVGDGRSNSFKERGLL